MSERDKSAAEMALDAIAEACGCAEWEYPGQVVRDVLAVVKERDEACVLIESLPAWGSYAWRDAAASVAVKLRENAEQIATLMRERDTAQVRVVNLEARLVREENSHSLTIDQRDRASDAADALAYSIGTVEDIGEHSNINDPWANALELLDVRLAHDRAAGQAESAARIAMLEVMLDDGIKYMEELVEKLRMMRCVAKETMTDGGVERE